MAANLRRSPSLLALASLTLALAAALGCCSQLFVAPPSTASSAVQRRESLGTAVSMGLAAALGVAATGELPAVAKSDNAQWAKEWVDPFHKGCPRDIQLGSDDVTLTITGEDGAPDCTGNDARTKWTVTGTVKSVTRAIIDFSPKGGPEKVLVKIDKKGIHFPDGNTWSKK
mmetsp:Transcript_15240/g.24282  ORF Transcript_15240/g.24282 Transcript_15240/m.24282 type:complete len:171 (-) Transcript_15240:306-818(-)